MEASTTGKGIFIPIGLCANRGIREFVAPSRGPQDDWELVLEDAAKGYASD